MAEGIFCFILVILSFLSAKICAENEHFFKEPNAEPYINAITDQGGPLLECVISERYVSNASFCHLAWIRVVNGTPTLLTRDKENFYKDEYELDMMEKGAYNLRIKKSSSKESGDYFCTFTDATGTDRRARAARVVFFEMPDRPTIVSVGPSVVREGELIETVCESRNGIPWPQFGWQFGNGTAISDDWHKVYCPNARLCLSRLRFQVFKTESGALLHCRVMNEATRSDGSLWMTSDPVKLNISYAPRVMLNQRTIYAVEEETPMNLKCSADANPAVQMEWMHVGSDLRWTTPEIHLIASRKHTGAFVCTATNSAGTDRAFVIVDVQYKPVVQIAAVHNFVQGQDATLICKVDANPGAESIRWEGPQGIASKSDRLELAGIGANMQGNYRCIATNRLSNSSLLREGSASTFVRVLDTTSPIPAPAVASICDGVDCPKHHECSVLSSGRAVCLAVGAEPKSLVVPCRDGHVVCAAHQVCMMFANLSAACILLPNALSATPWSAVFTEPEKRALAPVAAAALLPAPSTAITSTSAELLVYSNGTSQNLMIGSMKLSTFIVILVILFLLLIALIIVLVFCCSPYCARKKKGITKKIKKWSKTSGRRRKKTVPEVVVVAPTVTDAQPKVHGVRTDTISPPKSPPRSETPLNTATEVDVGVQRPSDLSVDSFIKLPITPLSSYLEPKMNLKVTGSVDNLVHSADVVTAKKIKRRTKSTQKSHRAEDSSLRGIPDIVDSNDEDRVASATLISAAVEGETVAALVATMAEQKKPEALPCKGPARARFTLDKGRSSSPDCSPIAAQSGGSRARGRKGSGASSAEVLLVPSLSEKNISPSDLELAPSSWCDRDSPASVWTESWTVANKIDRRGGFDQLDVESHEHSEWTDDGREPKLHVSTLGPSSSSLAVQKVAGPFVATTVDARHCTRENPSRGAHLKF